MTKHKKTRLATLVSFRSQSGLTKTAGKPFPYMKFVKVVTTKIKTKVKANNYVNSLHNTDQIIEPYLERF